MRRLWEQLDHLLQGLLLDYLLWAQGDRKETREILELQDHKDPMVLRDPKGLRE